MNPLRLTPEQAAEARDWAYAHYANHPHADWRVRVERYRAEIALIERLEDK